MRYYRCKCGNRESWSNMGSPACRACPHCKVTLAEHPDFHREPEPHMWEPRWNVDPLTGETEKGSLCHRCMKEVRGKLPDELGPEDQ